MAKKTAKGGKKLRAERSARRRLNRYGGVAEHGTPTFLERLPVSPREVR